jgi:hypothetical protein
MEYPSTHGKIEGPKHDAEHMRGEAIEATRCGHQNFLLRLMAPGEDRNASRSASKKLYDARSAARHDYTADSKMVRGATRLGSGNCGSEARVFTPIVTE